MRYASVILFLSITLHGISQLQWNTATRTGINRIGIGFDQSIGIDFGKNKNQTIALGAKWYGLDFVFAKETVGPVLDYRFNFNGGNQPKIQFSVGLSMALFIESQDSHQSRIAEFNLYNRGTIKKWWRIQPFYEIGIGMLSHTSFAFSPSYKSNYLNYSAALGIQFNFMKKRNE